MAMGAGLPLGNMTEGWWMPALSVPGEELDGAPYFRPLHSERAQPGAILVDRFGQRFVDEAQNYCDVGRAMQRFDATSYSYPASPCWIVFDAEYRARYPFGPLGPGGDDPAWLHRADDLDALGEQLRLPASALRATVSRFNRGAENGVDEDFGRGTFHYDRWIGDASAPHPTLAPLAAPPFYAAPVALGCLGTKGGPRTDDAGRVRTLDGGVLAGLYAAGNAAASPFGIGTAAGGGTIGPALVFGTRAGEAAAREGGRR
jgi:3-oxosteroid 1-dehydrogenase